MRSSTQALKSSLINHQARWVAACTVLSGLGLVIHNRADLAQLPWLSPETSIPLLISFLLFVGWWLVPLKRQIGVAFLAFSPRTNSVPLSDARSVYADPDPIGRDLAVASKTLNQEKRAIRC